MINIYQIESTSVCSATCSFCPHPSMVRTKQHMSFETFKQTLSLMANNYFAFHHFGEPLLHPELPEMIAYANSLGKRVEFSTNGKGLNDQAGGDDFLRRLMAARPYRIRVAYDFFRPDEFVKKLLTLNQDTLVTMHAVTKGLLLDHKPLNNWAGQMDMPSEISGECYFLKYSYYAVMSNGDVVPCCQDYEGKHVIGNVHDPASIAPQPTYTLCDGCQGMQFAEGSGWWDEIGKDARTEGVFNVPNQVVPNIPRERPQKRHISIKPERP